MNSKANIPGKKTKKKPKQKTKQKKNPNCANKQFICNIVAYEETEIRSSAL